MGTSYTVQDTHGEYEGHTYVSVFKLPASAQIVSGSINVAQVKDAPDLLLTLTRLSLAQGNTAFPVSRELISKEVVEPSNTGETSLTPRWEKLTEIEDVAIFENSRVLPRTWLANQVQVLSEADMLQTIRSSRLPNGETWDPLKVALIENNLDFDSQPGDEVRTANITRYEPNRVTISTNSSKPAVLVLGDNHYPGWRARVDGQDVETLRVDYNLRGVVLPAGQHTVEFVYRPKSVMLGVAVSFLTLTGLIVWWRRQSTNRS